MKFPCFLVFDWVKCVSPIWMMPITKWHPRSSRGRLLLLFLQTFDLWGLFREEGTCMVPFQSKQALLPIDVLCM